MAPGDPLWGTVRVFPTAFTSTVKRHKKTPLVCGSGVAVGLTIGNDFVGGGVGDPLGVETTIRCQGGTGVDVGQWWMIWCGDNVGVLWLNGAR